MKWVLFFVLMVLTFLEFDAQCEIKNKVYPDQTMYYYLEPEVFYSTDKNSLKGNITTDKDHYFLQLMPEPFPSKEENKKLTKNIIIKLTGKDSISLENYDARYRRSDTTLLLMYLIPKDKLADFSAFDVEWVNIDLGDEKGPRHYVFVLHKATLREQLNCLLKEK